MGKIVWGRTVEFDEMSEEDYAVKQDEILNSIVVRSTALTKQSIRVKIAQIEAWDRVEFIKFAKTYCRSPQVKVAYQPWMKSDRADGWLLDLTKDSLDVVANCLEEWRSALEDWLRYRKKTSGISGTIRLLAEGAVSGAEIMGGVMGLVSGNFMGGASITSGATRFASLLTTEEEFSERYDRAFNCLNEAVIHLAIEIEDACRGNWRREVEILSVRILESKTLVDQQLPIDPGQLP